MDKVYLLYAYEEDVMYGGDEILSPRLLGVYSTRGKAEYAKRTIKAMSFCGDPEDVNQREIKEIEVQ